MDLTIKARLNPNIDYICVVHKCSVFVTAGNAVGMSFQGFVWLISRTKIGIIRFHKHWLYFQMFPSIVMPRVLITSPVVCKIIK